MAGEKHTNGNAFEYCAAMDPSIPLTSSKSDLLERLNKDGFVIIRKMLSRQQIEDYLREAVLIADLARRGKWPYVRTLPKQFPPWSTDVSTGIWGVQHLLHPQFPGSAKFAEFYFGDPVIRIVKELLGVEQYADDTLVMELFNLLIRPDKDFELRWHRDDVSFDLGEAAEAQSLGVPSPLRPQEKKDLQWTKEGFMLDPRACIMYTPDGAIHMQRRPLHVQYNVPLYKDSSLQIIPGSHRRPRTPEECSLITKDACVSSLPGMISVALEAGDVVFYDNNIIHRGVYDSKVERLTLHGSVGDTRAGTSRARNVLQHALGSWIKECDFRSLKLSDESSPNDLTSRAEKMRSNLVRLGEEVGEVGFSHKD